MDATINRFGSWTAYMPIDERSNACTFCFPMFAVIPQTTKLVYRAQTVINTPNVRAKPAQKPQLSRSAFLRCYRKVLAGMDGEKRIPTWVESNSERNTMLDANRCETILLNSAPSRWAQTWCFRQGLNWSREKRYSWTFGRPHQSNLHEQHFCSFILFQWGR